MYDLFSRIKLPSKLLSFLGSGWHRWPWLSNRRSLDTRCGALRCGVTRSCRSPWKQLVVGSLSSQNPVSLYKCWGVEMKRTIWFCSFWSCFVAEDWIHLGNQRFPAILNTNGNSRLEVLLLLLYNALDLPVLMMKLYPNSKDAISAGNGTFDDSADSLFWCNYSSWWGSGLSNLFNLYTGKKKGNKRHQVRFLL